MRFWPLIAREFRVQSRLPRGHVLRLSGAFGLVLATYSLLSIQARAPVMIALGAGGIPEVRPAPLGLLERWAMAFEGFENQGLALLQIMNRVVLLTIWVLAPLLTADCLSSERRQGTLGILLLTPMRTADVVVAKMLVHGWQTLWVGLAGLPILVIPFLLGGVGSDDTIAVVLTDASILLLALTAGMLASSLWKSQRAVLIAAAGFAFAFGWVYLVVEECHRAVSVFSPSSPLEWLRTCAAAITGGFGEAWGKVRGMLFDGRWMLLARGAPPTTAGSAWENAVPGLVTALAVSFVALAAVVRHTEQAARREGSSVRTRRSATTESSTASPAKSKADHWRRTALVFLQKNNPFLWIEMRTWRGQIIPWLSLLIVFPWEASRTTPTGGWGLDALLDGPVWALASIMALASASCLHDERASGSLELLLTVPRGHARLMAGKFAALTLQILPAAILVFGIETGMNRGLWSDDSGVFEWLGGVLGLVLAVSGRIALAMAVGTFLGFQLRQLVIACAATFVTMRIVTWASGRIAIGVTGQPDFWLDPGTLAVAALPEIGIAVFCAANLHKTLGARRPLQT